MHLELVLKTVEFWLCILASRYHLPYRNETQFLLRYEVGTLGVIMVFSLE
jgi:hypothetical protein